MKKMLMFAMAMLMGICATAAESNAVSTAKEPGPMGKIVMVALRAANTGDFATAISCCNPKGAAKREVTESDKRIWGSITDGGQLSFSDEKTCWKKERETSDGKGVVFVYLVGKAKKGMRTFNMIKVNGEWKIDE